MDSYIRSLEAQIPIMLTYEMKRFSTNFWFGNNKLEDSNHSF